MTDNNIVPISQARMPAGMRERMKAGAAVNKNFESGIRDSFPRLSFSGKSFVIRKDGETIVLRDPATRYPYQYLDIVLLNGSERLSKAYYIDGYDESQEGKQPDCWSLDSIRPDASVVNPISPTCPNCPFDQFGSAEARNPTEGKRGGKRCSDVRRVAVCMPTHLDQEAPLIFMLRVAATSLKNLKTYAQNLERVQWEPNGCVTRLEFDETVTYPKLVFNFIDGLTDEEYAKAHELAVSAYVNDMLKAPDFDMAASNVQQEQAEKPKPNTRQASPIMDTQTNENDTPNFKARQRERTDQMQQAEVQAEKAAPLHAVDMTGFTELPDGQWINDVTGEFVDPPKPKVDMPAMDPNVTAMPDGRFFNRHIRDFVTGPEIGAKVVEKTPEGKPKPARQSRAKAKADAPVAEAKPEPKAQGRGPSPVDAALTADKAGVTPQETMKMTEKASGNGAGAKTAPTPAALDDLIRSVFPTAKT